MLAAIDTSTAQVGLALYDQNQLHGVMLWTTRRHHTTELAPALSDLLARCGYSVTDLQALAVAVGPGSFTSLRVGLSFVKGLALARDIPVIGMPTLDIIAQAQPVADTPLIAAIQAGRGRLAFRRYKSFGGSWQAEGPLGSGNVDELIAQIQDPTFVAGEFAPEEREKLSALPLVQLASAANCARRPEILAELAWKRWQAGDVDEAASLAPIYLHVAGAPPA